MAESPARHVSTHEAGALEKEFPVLLKDNAVIRVRYRGKGTRIVVSHGNGLAVDAYRTFCAALSERHQVVMFDFRHHGKSSPFKSPTRNWPQFVEDFDRVLSAIEAKLGKALTFGAFHSMSSLTALLHAAEQPTPWAGIVAFEPPVPPRKEHPLADPFFDMHAKLAEGAARRRTTFASVEELAFNLASRDTFGRLDARGVSELASSTLRFNKSTRAYELACDRDFEAETFRLRHLGDAWGRVSSVRLPVKVVAGVPGPNESRCLFHVARSVAAECGFEFSEIADATHFLQMERPTECVAAVETFINRHARNSGVEHV